MRTIDEVVENLAEILESLNIDYVLVGGVAVSGWGNVRTTRDIDVIMSLNSEEVGNLVRAFKERNFSLNEEGLLKALEEEGHFTIFDELSDFYIDAKGVYGSREKRTLKTKKKVYIGETAVYIASPEDVIANKLVFGSDQDLKDAEGICVRQSEKLDLDYLKKICSEMGVEDELEGLMKGIELES